MNIRPAGRGLAARNSLSTERCSQRFSINLGRRAAKVTLEPFLDLFIILVNMSFGIDDFRCFFLAMTMVSGGRLGRASIAVKSMALSVPPLMCVSSVHHY